MTQTKKSKQKGKGPRAKSDAERVGARMIAAERQRQVKEEGWTAAHDDNTHYEGELALAAACYTLSDSYALPRESYNVPRAGCLGRPTIFPAGWYWKPKDRMSDLVRAGALIAAEIDRLIRAGAARPQSRKAAK